jgi:hypothetical protein
MVYFDETRRVITVLSSGMAESKEAADVETIAHAAD